MVNKKTGLLVLICSFISFTVLAQQAKQETKEFTPEVWVQFNPFNLAEPETLVAFTGLYRPSSNWGFALDAGIYVAENFGEKSLPLGGFRLRPEVKFYLDNGKGKRNILYFSLQGLIKVAKAPVQDFITVTDAAGNPLYQQLIEYKERKTVVGTHINFGGEILLDKAKRVMLDIYGGVGVRKKQTKAISVPAGIDASQISVRDRQPFFTQTGIVLPSLTLGLKISYRIK
jgi:hypothetical protein